MKKLVLIVGIVLILLGLNGIIFHNQGLVAIMYLLAGAVLIIYDILFDKVRKIVHIAMGILYALPILMVAFLGIYGSHHTTDFTEDVVFVLGAGLRDDRILPNLEARLNQALYYFEQNPAAKFIVCGGYGADQTISEARAMADFLVAGGIPYEQIILEDASTNTYENFAFALSLLNNYFPDGFTSVIITNNFHIYRSGYIARHLEIRPNHFGAPTPIRSMGGSYAREILAVINTWLFQT